MKENEKIVKFNQEVSDLKRNELLKFYALISKQKDLAKNLVKDNKTMLNAEERLFTIGESSLFLINTRENNLVSAQLAQIALENRYYISNSDLFKVMANPD